MGCISSSPPREEYSPPQRKEYSFPPVPEDERIYQNLSGWTPHYYSVEKISQVFCSYASQIRNMNNSYFEKSIMLLLNRISTVSWYTISLRDKNIKINYRDNPPPIIRESQFADLTEINTRIRRRIESISWIFGFLDLHKSRIATLNNNTSQSLDRKIGQTFILMNHFRDNLLLYSNKIQRVIDEYERKVKGESQKFFGSTTT